MEATTSVVIKKSRHARRQLGSFYTPQPIVRMIVRGCLQQYAQCNPSAIPPRILDPSCGDGAFLEGVLNHFIGTEGSTAVERLSVIRARIFGVDVDPAATTAARLRLLQQIAPDTKELEADAIDVLNANIVTGDALTGADFSNDAPTTPDTFSWQSTFPEVAAAGGFDIVLGNPPYRRELDAKDLFDQIAQSPLGKRWREPRMDLWYYFLHRGIDLLRSGGVLSYIVGSYWAASRGAEKLIARLQRETTLDEVILLGDRKVFPEVQGRHLILRLRKERQSSPCQIVSFKNTREVEARERAIREGEAPAEPRAREFTPNPSNEHLKDPTTPPPEVYNIPQRDLYVAGRLTFAKPLSQPQRFARCTPLGDLFQTAQGMAENPPRVNRRIHEKLQGRIPLGKGVFVLTDGEVEQLKLTPHEQALLRPNYETSSLGRYRIPARPTHHVLYLTRETAPHIDDFPNVLRHLTPFRPVLDQRRETKLGRNAWWHLHWPRREQIFAQPSVLSVQMGKVPQFVMTSAATFVGFSVNVIQPSNLEACGLEPLTGILNSSLAAEWFARHAKQRGVNLEINLNVLRRFPLPPRDEELETQLTKLVQQRQSASTKHTDEELDSRIEEVVVRLYGG